MTLYLVCRVEGIGSGGGWKERSWTEKQDQTIGSLISHAKWSGLHCDSKWWGAGWGGQQLQSRKL